MAQRSPDEFKGNVVGSDYRDVCYYRRSTCLAIEQLYRHMSELTFPI